MTDKERTEERTKTHACDLISRQAAIEIIDGYMNRLANHIGTPTDNERYAYARGTLLGVERGINALPSAEPEIVKCKECRHVYYDKEFDNYWCDRMSDPFKVEADGYCKWGK